jgi:hypothetical protein
MCYLGPNAPREPDKPGANPQDYTVEVWQPADDGIEVAYTGTAQLDGQNIYCGAVMYTEQGGRRYLKALEGGACGPTGSARICAYGIGEDGQFRLVTELIDEYSYQDRSYTLNGQPISVDEGEKAASEWFDMNKRVSIGLSSVTCNGQPPYGLIRNTNTVVCVLEACAGMAGGSPSDSQESAVESAEDAAEAMPQQIVTPAYTVTIPEEWSDRYQYSFEVEAPPAGTTEMGFAWHATIYLDSNYAFDVAAVTDDWGLQGAFRSVNLGPSQTYPGWTVFVYAPIPSYPDDFVGWVSTTGNE